MERPPASFVLDDRQLIELLVLRPDVADVVAERRRKLADILQRRQSGGWSTFQALDPAGDGAAMPGSARFSLADRASGSN